MTSMISPCCHTSLLVSLPTPTVGALQWKDEFGSISLCVYPVQAKKMNTQADKRTQNNKMSSLPTPRPTQYYGVLDLPLRDGRLIRKMIPRHASAVGKLRGCSTRQENCLYSEATILRRVATLESYDAGGNKSVRTRRSVDTGHKTRGWKSKPDKSDGFHDVLHDPASVDFWQNEL